MKAPAIIAVVGLATTYSCVANAGEDAGSNSVTELEPVQVLGDQPSVYGVLNSTSATRTDTPLKEIPQSIQVLPRQLIDDQQSVTVSEALRNVSGFVPENAFGTPAFDSTLLRGFDAEQLIDGFTQYYNPGDREGTINIDRIEVLKGANAVLYSGGSGAPLGGVVNIVSKLPTATAAGQLGVRGGTDGFVRPFFDFNQPLNENVLFRITGEYTRADSDIDVIEQRRFNVNPSVTVTNNRNTSLTIQSKIARWDQQEYQGLPAVGTVSGDFRIDPETFVGPDDVPDSKSHFSGVWATLEHRFNDRWSFTAKARHAGSSFTEKVQTLVGADGFQANLPFFGPSTWALVNAELFQEQTENSVLGNVVGKFDLGVTRNTLLIGADYSSLDDAGFIDSNFFAGGSGAVDLTNPVFPSSYSDPGPGINNQFVLNETYGAYAQVHSTILDRLHLLAGLRAAHVGIDFNETTFGGQAKSDKDKVLPRIGGVVDVTSNISLFAQYTQGMRGQPFVNFVSSPEPEESEHVEGGIKVNFGNRLIGQLAVYHIDRTNVAVTDNTDPFFRSVAEGEQESQGVELDVTWQATRNLSLLATYAHTEAEFTNSLFGVPAGNRLTGVPEDSGRIWANYRFSQRVLQGFSIGAGAYAQSATFISNDNQLESDGYFTVDAAIAYTHRWFDVGLSIKNLTDEEYFDNYEYFGGRVAPGAGRAAYATVSVRY
jgi:iron complex outermembrane receptor protein